METLDRINSCLKANPPIPFRKAEIFCMRTEMRRINPVFYEKLVIEHQLPLSKYDICILYRLRVKPAHIAILLGMGRSTITTERHRIYEHIFSKKDEGEEFMSFINSIH